MSEKNDVNEDEVKRDKILSKHLINGRTYNLMQTFAKSGIPCEKCIFINNAETCNGEGGNLCKDEYYTYLTESTYKSQHLKGHYNERGEFIIPIQLLEKETSKETKENKGIKYDDGKIQWWYLPIEPIKEVLKVLHYGDKKYPADDGCNWKRVPNAKKRYYSALMRHITAWWDEEKNDQESGMHHLAHACTNVLFLLYFEMKGYPEDKKND